MAGRPIEIPISVTADGAEKGVSKVADAFDDLEGSLKDVSKAGDKTGKDLKSDMSDAAKKIDRDLTQALDSVADSGKSTGRTIGREVKDGTSKAKEGLEELKGESHSTAKEAAASFSEVGDAADALQEVAANALAGFGPAGAAAGIVAAIGIGLAIKGLQDAADAANAAGEQVGQLGQSFKDAGGKWSDEDLTKRMEEFGFQVQDSKEWWEIWQKDAVTGFEKMAKAASDAGVPIKSALTGIFGPAEQSAKLLSDIEAEIQKVTAAETRQSALKDELGNATTYVTDAGMKQLQGLKDLKEQAEKNAEQQSRLIRQENIRRESIDGTTQALKENIAAQEKSTDAQKNALTSEFDLADKQDDLTQKLTDSSNAWDANTKAGRDNQRAVVDIANGIEEVAKAAIDAGQPVDTVTAKFNAQKDALITQVMPAFGGSREAAQKYIDTILTTPSAKTTTVTVQGIQEAEAKVREFTEKGRHLSVDIQTGSTTSVDNWLEGVNGKKVYVDFVPRGGSALSN